MKRKFLVNLILLLVLNLLVKPFWVLGIDRKVNVLAGPEDYGEYFALFNFSLLFNILLDIGITNYNNRNIAQHRHLLSKYFEGILSLKILLAFGYTVFTIAVAYWMGYTEFRMKMLGFLVLNQILVSMNLYLRSNISGLHLFRTDAIISVLDRILMIGLASAVIWGGLMPDGAFNMMWFVYIQTLGYGVTTLISFIIVMYKAGGLRLKLKKPFSLMILKQTLPYALLVLTMTFYYRVDAVMLDLMRTDGEQQAGIYAQAYRLLDAANMYGVLFAQLLLPMFAYMIRKKEAINDLLKISFNLLFIPSFVLAFICIMHSGSLMELMYGGYADESAPVLNVLMGCFVAIASTYIFGTLLTANGSLKQLNMLAITGLVVNIILNAIMIPRSGAVGSAYASLITQLLVIAGQLLMVWKIFKLNLQWSYMGKLLVFMTVTVVAGYLGEKLSWSWWWIGLLTGGIGVLSSMILGLIQPREIKRIISAPNNRS